MRGPLSSHTQLSSVREGPYGIQFIINFKSYEGKKKIVCTNVTPSYSDKFIDERKKTYLVLEVSGEQDPLQQI
jgi:hypothetical protein